MIAPATMLHATAIVAGTRGILFVGPSGSGKSSLAFSCLSEARNDGRHARLVGDDQILTEIHGTNAVARCPNPIRGLIELRHGDIGVLECQAAAVLDFAVLPVDAHASDRLPPENEHFVVNGSIALPLLRLPIQTIRPLAFLDILFSTRERDCAPQGLRF